jgi:hypothetical protein
LGPNIMRSMSIAQMRKEAGVSTNHRFVKIYNFLTIAVYRAELYTARLCFETIDKTRYFTYNDTRYMLLLANGALRVVGEYSHDRSACKDETNCTTSVKALRIFQPHYAAVFLLFHACSWPFSPSLISL